MDVIGLSQLGPIIAAILGPMLAFVVASMRFQHLEAVKTRELISNSERETRNLISNSERGIRSELVGCQLTFVGVVSTVWGFVGGGIGGCRDHCGFVV